MRIAAHFTCATLVLGTLCSALSCSSPSTNAPAPARPAPAQPLPPQKKPLIDLPKLEKQVHDRINKTRVMNGLATMRWDDALGRIARKHSRDMARSNYFGHTSPDGRGYSHRYMKDGYACGVTVGGVLRRGGENICRLSPGEEGDLAAAVIREWMANSEDRKNLLSSPWEREGIGICIGPDGLLYITLNFC